MFKELEDALRFDKFYAELDDVGKRLRDAGIKYNSFSRWRWSKDKSEKLPESKIGELQEIARKCVDGAAELDRIIEGFKSLRDNLARHVFQIRDAFPSFNASVTKEMRDIAEKGKDLPEDLRALVPDKTRSALARFLGYDKLPDNIVDVDLFMDESMVIASFGLKGKPTRMGIGIPVTVDYANNYHVNDLDDGPLQFAKVGVGELEKLIPLLVLEISVGASQEDYMSTTFKTVEDLKSAIEKMFDYDVRDSIKKIGDISEVKDADDFSAWRMRRSANRRAAENA